MRGHGCGARFQGVDPLLLSVGGCNCWNRAIAGEDSAIFGLRDPSRSPEAERLLRRVMLALVVAMAGLAMGTLVWPAVEKHYYLSRLEHADPVERLKAMNRLAGPAVRDVGLAEVLLGALIEEDLVSEAAQRRGVELVAGWVVGRLAYDPLPEDLEGDHKEA